MSFDYIALGLGFGVGLLVSALFFVGLAFGMRKALNSTAPAIWLLVSFVVRSVLLVSVALYLIKISQPLMTLTGFTLAFFIVRLMAVGIAKNSVKKDAALQVKRVQE